uniref:Uncharacterized protein n=1 Tax=Moniliophthora roreri TaxID=221103 RepID=A0A0W0G5Y6_MONRR
MLPKSFSQSQTTLTTVEGYPLKRRRLEGFKSETNLASQSRTFQLSPTPTLAPSCSHSHIPPATIELRQLVIPPRPDSPVPTEPDADHADRADVERDLERRWGIKVKDYARLPAITAQNSKGKEKERTRVWEAFFAKDAMGQYEWFMSRGSKEWLVLKWEGTEVLEESQEQEEKTEEDVEHPKTPPLAEQALPQQGQQQASPQASPGRSPRPLVRTTYNPLALAGRKPPSTSPRREVQLGHEAQQSSPKRGLTRQDTEVAVASSSKPPSTTNPGRALVRHTRNPMTMVSTNATPNTSSFSTPPNSTASSSSDPEKTPLLPSPSFSLFQRKRDIRKYGIPGKFLYRLRELGWVTEEEARRRWLGCDWDEYNHYIDEETKRGNKRGDGEIEKEVGFMGKGTVGYPYFVIWGSVGTGALGVGSRKDKGKEKEKAQVPVPESELGQEAEESQNVHATLSGTIEDQDREKTPPLHEDQEKTPPIHGSIDSGYVETEPDDMDVEEEQSQNVHATLSGSLSPPAGSPPPPAAASSSSSSQQQRDQETTSSPPKQKRPNPLAPLYFHAIAEDSSLAFGRPPSKEYRQLLGERAGDVWNWLNEWVRFGRAGKRGILDSLLEDTPVQSERGGPIGREPTLGRALGGLVRGGTLASIPGPAKAEDKDKMDVDPTTSASLPSSSPPRKLELPPSWLSSMSSLSSLGSREGDSSPVEDAPLPPESSSPAIPEPEASKARKRKIPTPAPTVSPATTRSKSKKTAEVTNPPPPRRSTRHTTTATMTAPQSPPRRSTRRAGGGQSGGS